MKGILPNLLGNKFLARAIKLSSVSIVSNFLGFLIPIYIAYRYSISKETDDFFLSYSIILFVGNMFAGSVRTVIIPFLKERISDSFLYSKFISTVFIYFTKLLLILCVALFVTSLALFVWTDKQLYWFLFLSVPIVYFSVINSFFYGVLNSIDQFYVAEFSPFSRAIIIFVTIYFLGSQFGISAVIIGYNLGELGKFFHLLYIIRIKNKLTISRKNYDFKEISVFLKQGFFQIASVTIAASSPLVDRVVAAFLAVGAVSLIDYGDKVFSVFTVLLGSFLTLLLSKWSGDVVSGNFRLKKLHKTMLIVFTLSIAVFVFILIFKFQIISVIYSRVPKSKQEIIAYILLVNMAGFILNSLNQVINNAVIALKFTRNMVITSTVKFVINIIVDILFAKIWGVIGIAYASVLVHGVGLVINYLLLKSKMHSASSLKGQAA
ncbi:hypothetical protein FPZ43_14105 [Mucilaginibacter pallidiroseus]|uniref:Polysaccharide biosynthesis protein C-terminal domain-containing protein n=1 Tax=Mucilaginibacter pallidiroseus TaxID=2599295 RepID=A0A563U8B6_9SPHI|nr:lipid II flippase MurJ [Mucilaginibacter pallidiroseus]TWR27597.1 hypothetical protein FPZ43_14105 [Mucilaginibacter pallidiroseus]